MDNLLPYDGNVYYHNDAFSQKDADDYVQILMDSIRWQNDSTTLFGKTHVLSRKAAWYGDAPFVYKYSGSIKTALAWTSELLKIKDQVETVTGSIYNSCLLNLYHNGSEGMSWHSDDEKTMQTSSAIASVSFGAERNFDFKHKKTREKVRVTLANGSILLMTGETQRFWLHSLPKSIKVRGSRVNLTFRSFATDNLK